MSKIVDMQRESKLVCGRTWAEFKPGRAANLEKNGVLLLSDAQVERFRVDQDGDTITLYTERYEDGTEKRFGHSVLSGLQDWEDSSL